MLIEIYHKFCELLSAFNSALFTFIMMPALLFVGIFYTLRTGFVQFRALSWLSKAKIRALLNSSSSDGGKLSNFESFVISSGARIGVGNIIGIALAVKTGGPGAIVYMFIAAFFGCASAFSECSLAKAYAKSASGGVAHYIQYGLNSPKLARVFIFCLVAADAFGFNPLLAYTLNTQLLAHTDINVFLGSLIISLVAALVFCKGVNFSRFIVPAMLAGYLFIALIIALININKLQDLLALCFHEAFSLKAGLGGLLGSSIMIGIKQGLFSNEAGLGSAPNAASAASCAHPCVQGIVQMCAVGFDLAICAASALIALSVYELSSNDAQEFMNLAFVHYFGQAGSWVFLGFVVAFCVTSFYGNYYYSTRALSLLGPTPKWFLPACLIACYIGGLYNALLAWDLASTLMCAMALINLYAIVRLHKQTKALLDEFYQKFVR